ncbi:MAG: response regulator [Desulfobacterium sp.]|nr:response regulator [Desulfobacterium sp.]
MRNVRLKPKLVFLFLMTGFFPLLVLGLLGSKLSSDALMEKSFNQLDAVKELTSNRFASLLKERLKEVALLADTKDVKEACKALSLYYGKTNTAPGLPFPVNTASYTSVRDRYLPYLSRYIKAYDYHDVFIIGSEHGNVLFSATEMTPTGGSLSQGPLKDSGLAQVWQRVVKTEKAVLVDFEPYTPSNGMESAFIGYPVYDDASRMISVVALQCTSRFINEIMDIRAGMGETGVSYLIRRYRGGITGQDKYELRSDIKLVGGGRYVIGSLFKEGLAYWKDAMRSGGTGGHGLYTDNAGNVVLVSYSALDFIGEDWALISKIDKAEVMAPLWKLIKSIFAGGGVIFLLIAAGSFRFARGLTQPIITDMEFAQAISRGELDRTLRLKRRDELGDLGRALDTMAANLRELGWLQSGKEGLDDQLRGDLTPEEMAKRFISYMVKHLGGHVGTLYTTEDQENLELTASYAFTDRQGNFSRIRVGEGLVGQVALEREVIVFTNAGEEAPLLNYGMGERNLDHLLTAPLVFQDKLLGVFQVGATAPFSPLQRRFVEKNAENISILFNAARSRRVIHDLLDRSQQQQEELQTANGELEEQARALMDSEGELQAQQEELRVTNQELEEQANALRESEGELQAQQEELRVTNEELEEQTTALKSQKAALGEKNNELLRAQDNIKQKAKDLEIASTYKSEFLANMSHELRTPLNSILILSQLFSGNREGNLTEKQVESATAIHSSGSDLLKLINDVLDLSKVEAGMLELSLEEVPMVSMVGELTRLFNGVAENKGVEFVIDLKADAPGSILTDSHRLQQILRNLITNAFKFTEQGRVTLTVSRPGADTDLSRSGLLPDEAVALSVTDTGIGIPEERQEDIFKAFQQVDGSTSRKYGGTGLGLSISRELATLLGGEIGLVSEAGKGCTFSLLLPVRHQDVETNPGDSPEKKEGVAVTDDRPSQPPVPPSLETVMDDRRDLKPGDNLLLIIEDDPKFSGILKNLATQRGFKCLVAGDGETGLHFADYYGPSAILLDIGLPGIDGWEVMERLKGNPELRHIPVHFISASDESMEALQMGAVEYLTKPVSVETIEETLTRIETHLSTPMKRLLVVEDDELQRESIKELMGNGDVTITTVGTGKEAFQEIVTGRYDCMILDLGLGDMSGFDLLKMIRDDRHCPRIPIIIYTGRDLTRSEDEKLQKYAETIIIKGVRSPERLLEEASLFLHRVEVNLPEEKQKVTRIIHDKESALSGKNILLVDDDMRNVFALSSVLEEKEMNIIVARDGIEAVENIDLHKEIDLVLMDIMMPRMDGYQAMTEIRKREWCEKLPMIALTAKAMKGDRNRCIEAGASDYLAKPVDTDKLLSMLRVWLY